MKTLRISIVLTILVLASMALVLSLKAQDRGISGVGVASVVRFNGAVTGDIDIHAGDGLFITSYVDNTGKLHLVIQADKLRLKDLLK